MTRKDFELIAKAIARAGASTSTPIVVQEALDDLARDLAGELKADNPRFDTARFLRACGVEA